VFGGDGRGGGEGERDGEDEGDEETLWSWICFLADSLVRAIEKYDSGMVCVEKEMKFEEEWWRD
ncbi:hypothetical protein A2U01_0050944, partial [Trifolium medium]|nr:hypothetical protein [Trifolium medium]